MNDTDTRDRDRLEEYMSEEAADFVIDKAHLTSCFMKLPNLHSKWMRRYMNEQKLFLKMEARRRDLFRTKHEFYATKSMLDIKPNHLLWYVEADKEYSKLLTAISWQKMIVDYLEGVVKKVKDQNYILRNIQEWERFKAGA